jgi:hypothetical protein
MQGECQSSLQMSTKRHVWKYVCSSCSNIMKKERLFYSRLSQVMEHEFTTMNLEADIKVWSVNTSLSRIKKFKTVPSARKVTLTLCWTLLGPSLRTTRIMDRQSIVHSIMLCLKRIHIEHRGILTSGVILYDTTQPHMATTSVNMIKKLKFLLLPHPACSPELAPSDYHIFRRHYIWLLICKWWRDQVCSAYMV